MKTLRTLHIRNLPKSDLNAACLPTDYMVKSLATMVADILAKGIRSNHPPLLNTIAIGTPVYRDIYIGSNHFPHDPARDYMQLRVYHVDYKCQSILGTSPMVTQVAKGTADDAATCLDKDLLHDYWLA